MKESRSESGGEDIVSIGRGGRVRLGEERSERWRERGSTPAALQRSKQPCVREAEKRGERERERDTLLCLSVLFFAL